jgi:predicted HAD superfamily Cof-like phosphohydrolase
MKLIKEEFEELLYAWNEEDIVEVADACADLKWVIEGMEHTLGINQQAVWDEVARSNMSKMVGGKLIKREDGKVLKPATFVKPDIKKALGL